MFLIPPIHIDLSDVLNEFNIYDKDVAENIVDSVIKKVTYRFYESWSVTAANELKSTRVQYVNSLQVYNEGKMQGAVILHNKLPNMIEEGASPFDMKLGFANSSKAKVSKSGGWYLTIPYRFAAPDSLGESEVFVNKLPKEVHEVVKSLASTKSEFKASVVFGEQLKKMNIPEKYRVLGNRAAVSDSQTKETFDEYTHKNSIYEGLQKSSKKYQNATQSMYNTFRRVSNMSDANAWIYKGLLAKKLAERTFSSFNIDEEVDIAVDLELSRLGF